MKAKILTLLSIVGLSVACSTTDSNLAHAELKQVHTQSLPRLIGNTWQFYSQTPDKKPGYFKDKKAVEAYFNPRYEALKRRNPAADAKAAADQGQRLLMGMYYMPNEVLNTNKLVWKSIGLVSFKDEASYQRCLNTGLKRLEGTSNIESCHGVKACEAYRGYATGYLYRFNNVMVSYCNKPVQKK